MIRRLLLCGTCCVGCVVGAAAQNIRGHYVSKAETDGVIYHTFPRTLFENAEVGSLTFDITYKEYRDGEATINFTCTMTSATPVDSVRFVSGDTRFGGPAEKIYLEPDRKAWKHRYSIKAPVGEVGAFFDETAEPSVTLYAGERTFRYRVRRSAWRSYAPVGYRIFEMIRVNEGR